MEAMRNDGRLTSARARAEPRAGRVVEQGMADPRDTDPIDRNPRERGLERRSGGGAVSPWLMIGGIALLAVVAYAVFALL